MSRLRALARAARLKLAESRFHLPDLPTRAELEAEFRRRPQGPQGESGVRSAFQRDVEEFQRLGTALPPQHPNCRVRCWDEGDPGGDRTARIALTRGLVHRDCGGRRRSGIVVFDSSLLTLRCAACDQTWDAAVVMETRHLPDAGLESETIPVAAAERAIWAVHERSGAGVFHARPSPASEESLRARRAARGATVQPPDHNEPLAPRRRGFPIYRPS